MDDSTEVYLSLSDDDYRLPGIDSPFEYIDMIEQIQEYIAPEGPNSSELCVVCKRNFIVNFDCPRKKRKRTEPLLPSEKVCQSCRALDKDQLSQLQINDSKAKRIIKRQQAKRRAEIGGKAITNQMIDEINNNQQLSDNEKKKLLQKYRNRISAQQSRDRRREHITNIENENRQLMSENSILKQKLFELKMENRFLKGKLSQNHVAVEENYESFSFAGLIKGTTLALATIVSVALLVQSISSYSEPQLTHQSRQLIGELDLNQYKDDNGISLQQRADYAFEQLNVNIEDFIPRKLPQLPDPSMATSLAPKQGNLRGVKPEDCIQQIKEGEAVTTLLCPEVQVHWDNSIQPQIKYVQLVMPLDAFPSMYPAEIGQVESRGYYLDVLCSVIDIGVTAGSEI